MALSLAQAFPQNRYMYQGTKGDASPRVTTPMRSRGDPYVKLIQRFYEALILLNILGQTRGLRDVNFGTISTSEERRRRLLRNLAYLCDYRKGGETTAAIALEEKYDAFTFWLASNTVDSSKQSIAFLEIILAEAKAMIHPPKNQRVHSEDEFTWMCIDFAKSRVKKEIKMLELAIRNCEKRLEFEDNDKGESLIHLTPTQSVYPCFAEIQYSDTDLRKWLRQFLGKNYVETCFLAYKERRSRHMRYMESKIARAHEQQIPSETPTGFDMVRHSIGRLADHVRAPKQVIEDLTELDRFLDTYNVCEVPQVDNTVAPKADDHTTLDGIIKRMFPSSGDSLLREYEEHLPIINQKLSLQEKFMQHYNDKDFEPKVHAEIRVLEHFYGNRLLFADHDRFIGCSRPSCYCCQLYIQHHPLHCVKPEGHYKIWVNWGPPGLPGGVKDPKYKHQRDILNRMLPELRREALDQLKKKVIPFPWHPDSHTGITQSEASERRRAIQRPSLETGFASLRIGNSSSTPG